MTLDKSKANVIERGGHTLFLFTAKKADGSNRDPVLARQQLATILNVPLVKVVINHDYKDKPKGIASSGHCRLVYTPPARRRVKRASSSTRRLSSTSPNGKK